MFLFCLMVMKIMCIIDFNLDVMSTTQTSDYFEFVCLFVSVGFHGVFREVIQRQEGIKRSLFFCY